MQDSRPLLNRMLTCMQNFEIRPADWQRLRGSPQAISTRFGTNKGHPNQDYNGALKLLGITRGRATLVAGGNSLENLIPESISCIRRIVYSYRLVTMKVKSDSRAQNSPSSAHRRPSGGRIERNSAWIPCTVANQFNVLESNQTAEFSVPKRRGRSGARGPQDNEASESSCIQS